MDGMLSQEEINALLSGIGDSPATGSAPTRELSAVEKDAVGEISNISMGTAATTLSTLLSQRVNITTPQVTYATWDNITAEYQEPCVFIQVYYTAGLDGNNILILKKKDAKVITSLMMGQDPTDTDGELTELDLSAISEAMNQMMGSSSTSLSSMLEKKIDISPPTASLIKINDSINASDIADFLAGDFINVKFKMEIGDLVNSEIMQMYSFDFAKAICEKFIGSTDEAAPAAPAPAPAPSAPAPAPAPAPMPDMGMYGQPAYQQMPQMMQPQMAQMQQAYQQQMQPQMMQPAPGYAMPPIQDVNIAPVQFQPFTQVNSPLLKTENIDLLLDVPLEVTAELGRTSKSIKEILDFAPGTIIELNRLAGEPVDVLVNGKFVAKGEVVVIEEAFGIRVTEVIK
ncbi:MAG: flagellar motor switch phosphatase FliY [Lachnospiraceae bacterium]|nr:flagellar motor switch phosphatase FliY [Lachnospiraceae bacterium]